VSDQDDCALAFFHQEPFNTFLEEVTADVHVQGRQRVIQNHNVVITVHGSGHANSLLLTTAQVDSFLPNLCLIPCRKDVDIWLQGAGRDHSFVSFLVIAVAKEYIVFQCRIQQPWLLCSICNRTASPSAMKNTDPQIDYTTQWSKIRHKWAEKASIDGGIC
jgi:hypothetical protein